MDTNGIPENCKCGAPLRRQETEHGPVWICTKGCGPIWAEKKHPWLAKCHTCRYPTDLLEVPLPGTWGEVAQVCEICRSTHVLELHGTASVVTSMVLSTIAWVGNMLRDEIKKSRKDRCRHGTGQTQREVTQERQGQGQIRSAVDLPDTGAEEGKTQVREGEDGREV